MRITAEITNDRFADKTLVLTVRVLDGENCFGYSKILPGLRVFDECFEHIAAELKSAIVDKRT